MTELLSAILEIVFSTIDIFLQWRFTICFFGSFAIAAIVFYNLGGHSLGWIAGGAILLVGAVVGVRWEAAS